MIFVLLIAIGCLGHVSGAPNMGSRPPIPTTLSLTPSTIKITNTAGSGGNKGQQLFQSVVGPDQNTGATSCTAPGDYGWHEDNIAEVLRKTNLKLEPFDWLCKGKEGYWIEKGNPPSIIAEDCICPSSAGWSQQNLQGLQNMTRLTGSHRDCFCSSREGYSLHTLEPVASTEEVCQCPIARGWTSEELEQQFIIRNIHGGVQDCFCENSNGNVIRQKIPVGVTGSSSTTDAGIAHGILPKPQQTHQSISQPLSPIKECRNCQSGPNPSPPGVTSKFVMLSLDGKMKEFLLGPLSVTFHK